MKRKTKSILKMAGGIVLCLALPSFLIPMIIKTVPMGNEVEKIKAEKAEFIDNYKKSEEFQLICEEKTNEYRAMYNSGRIEQDEYYKKLDELLSDEFAENQIKETADMELVVQLNDINNELSSAKDKSTGYYIGTLLGAVLVSIPAGAGIAICGIAADEMKKRKKQDSLNDMENDDSEKE